MKSFRDFFRNLLLKFKALPKALRISILALFSLFILFIIIDLIFPLRTDIQYSSVILDEKGEMLNAKLSKDEQWRMECELSEIDPLLVKMVLNKEDRWFYFHPGINLFSIVRATWQNIIQNKRVSGASTISMQVARMIEPKERTFPNKIKEAFRALQLEFHYSKKSILKIYFNLLPYGGNIQGVKAACYFYLLQPPNGLSAAQATTIALMPNNPNLYKLGADISKTTTYRNYWLSKMFKRKIISEEQYINAIHEVIELNRREAPKNTPHLARWLYNRHKKSSIIKTFINQNYQTFVEDVVKLHVNQNKVFGISNAAAVVIDNKTHKLVAYVGSADFNDFYSSGQVDGVIALRSPGSALKPFLYAAAMDKGLITPKTILEDIPKNFNGFRPQNYDQTFRGKVSATDALSLSLNIPAVDLLNEIGDQAFNNILAKGGFRWISKNSNKLGLSVILGGCGVTLFELTGMYQTLACQGLRHNTLMTEFDKETRPDTLFSPSASWMITNILTKLKRPDLPNNFENSVNLPRIAWKTGTSYGRRDAWSVGYNPYFTVGVWVGNFDGNGVPEISGAELATPILFKIFNFLMSKNQQEWYKRPPELDYRLVCTETGMPKNNFCESIAMDDYIPLVSGNKLCNHLSRVYINADSTVLYCQSCLPNGGYKEAYYPNYSSGLISYYESMLIPYKKLPSHNINCTRVFSDSKPAITSLEDGAEYVLIKDKNQQLKLSCAAQPNVDIVFWYIDDQFFKKTKRNEQLFFFPKEGVNKISCSDDKGRNTDIRIFVRFIE